MPLFIQPARWVLDKTEQQFALDDDNEVNRLVVGKKSIFFLLQKSHFFENLKLFQKSKKIPKISQKSEIFWKSEFFLKSKIFPKI